MQLVAYGAQDIYLTGNPQITFFKVVYRRHTNFAVESIEQTYNGTVGQNSRVSVTVSRNGDLVSNVYVRIVSTGAVNTVDAHTLVSEVECEIGGQLIDRHTTEWLQLWSELTTPSAKAHGYKFMTGGYGEWGSTTDANNTGVAHAMVPLRFWFCRNPGLALPLIALQYHEVKLKFTWGAATATSNATVWADYIYLDTDERRRFAQVSHEYLIEQLQRQPEGTSKANHKLNFNHPVKELIWTESTTTVDNTTACVLVLNGHDRFAAQYEDYFTLRQPYEYHTTIPRQNILGDSAHANRTNVVNATGVTTGYASSNDLTTQTYIAMSDATTVSADNASGSRKYIQVAEEQASAFKVGHSYSTEHTDLDGDGLDKSTSADMHHIIDPVCVVKNYHTTCTYVSAAGSNGARVIGFSKDVHSGGDGETGDNMSIIALDGDTSGRMQGRTSGLTATINVYSFALKPEEHQPSGTCNFSRIDNASLNFEGTAPTINNIYAVNYNVLRIMSGMGGLAYSN